ncbi:MAG: hypothetical protein RLY46_71 [Bacteroidota bacterium]|jgi:hypothetical protein
MRLLHEANDDSFNGLTFDKSSTLCLASNNLQIKLPGTA